MAANGDGSHVPPFPVRVALVSATTALATPSFPALGFLYLTIRVTVPDPNLRQMMVGKWGSLLSFTTWTLIPYLFHPSLASLILPCAVGNAVVAGGTYGLADLACGGPGSGPFPPLNKALKTPWIGGSGIGAAVGYIAPNFLYGPILERWYELEGATQSVAHLMDFPLATEVSVATGAVAGMLLHPLLFYPTHGVPGLHWGYLSGTALTAVSAGLLYVYYWREGTGLPVPRGSFVSLSDMALVDSVLRYNNSSGDVETYTLKERQFVGSPDKCLEGQRIAEECREFAHSGKRVFDDRLLAFVYNFWDANLYKRHPEHVVNIKSEREIQETRESLAITDAAVAILMQRDARRNDQAGSAGCSSADLLTSFDDILTTHKVRKQVPFLDDAVIAIELLMISGRPEQAAPIDADINAIEQFVKGRCPEIALYAGKDAACCESVEGQLRSAGWKGPNDVAHAEGAWERVRDGEARRVRRKRALMVAATGVLLSVMGALLSGR
ncbi:hypothetical protein ACHAWF_012133 [Thalassiosira exigua]